MYKILLFLTLSFTIIYCQNNPTLYAGFRASRVLNSYPNKQFPSPEYWNFVGNSIASKFTGSQPAGIWIVSLYVSNGVTQLNFPSPGGSFPYINFLSYDQNEEYLNKFDNQGIKVWLQVEPGAASVDTLIYIVLNKYKHRPCVIGFGIDVEWYLANQYNGGKKVTDEEAARWESKVKKINSNYTLFLKHYSPSWMPPAYRGNIIFIDDSQDFNFSSNPLNAMISEFKLWGQKFYPNKVGFQYGYAIDSVWWKKYSDPVKTIGDALLSNIPNCKGLFWVDFTINKIYPVLGNEQKNLLSKDFVVYPNYPNPFNNQTIIKYHIFKDISDNLYFTVYDILGKIKYEANYKINGVGEYQINFNASNLSSGVYYYKLEYNNKSFINKFILVK